MRDGQMAVQDGNRSRPFGLAARVSRFLGDRRGAAAIEFAFIAPLLLVLYFVTMEVSQAIEANKKVGRIGSMVADLVTQQPKISRTELEAIMRIGEAILQPYNRSQPEITVTAIEITDEATPKVRVVWARKLLNGIFSAQPAKLSITTVPPKLMIKGSFLIRVESALPYEPMIASRDGGDGKIGLAGAFNEISMLETYYLRPRLSTTIPCDDC
jgi:Flp pilus assembly protein TadG